MLDKWLSVGNSAVIGLFLEDKNEPLVTFLFLNIQSNVVIDWVSA